MPILGLGLSRDRTSIVTEVSKALDCIGLPTAALLAGNGFNVVGVDLNEHAVETINQGRIHIVEPDLDAFVRSAIATL
jgi:UDP-N-acetyl-D-mannosaminuronic acid dehydrogenase